MDFEVIVSLEYLRPFSSDPYVWKVGFKSCWQSADIMLGSSKSMSHA